MHLSLCRFVRLAALTALIASMWLAPTFSFARTHIPAAAQPQLAASADGRVWLAYGQTRAAPVATERSHDGSQGGGAGHGGGTGHVGHGKGSGQPRPDGDIFVACSDDDGATFAPAVKVATVPSFMLGMRRGPRIAAHGDTLTVTAIGAELVAFRSTDAGRTWSGPVTINEVSTSAREGLHDLAAAPDGALFATWLDLRNGKMELWGAESRDGGKTWGKNEQVYRSPDKSICECCHPSALFDAEGNLAVMWRNSIEGSRDLWMTTRAKSARSFSTARKLGEGTWKLNACPMDGGRIVALGGGKFGAVWMRAGEVFFTPPEGAEILLGKGRQAVAATRASETLIVWQQDANLVSVRKPGAQAQQLAVDARFASALTLPQDKGVVLAYEQGPAKEKQPGIVIERL